MKKVLLWGNSIFLAGLATALQGVAGLEVNCAARDLAETVRQHAPDVVIVDLADAQCGDALALLRAHPTLGLIGVNAATGAVSALAGQVHLTETLEEVTKTILDF